MKIVSSFLMLSGLCLSAVSAEQVLVKSNAKMKYLANVSAPSSVGNWMDKNFDDNGWRDGTFGVGYEKGATTTRQIKTPVSVGTMSVYCRTSFSVGDLKKIKRLSLGVDYDDACAVWLNGKELFRSRNLPKGELSWAAEVSRGHEADGRINELFDISKVGLSALKEGKNVLAVGVWNLGERSSDLLAFPILVANAAGSSAAIATTAEQGVARGPYLQQGSPSQMIVRWRTNRPTDSVLKYGTAPGRLNQQVALPDKGTEHVLTLTDLKPYTTYYYSIGDSGKTFAGGDDDHFFKTSPEMGKGHPTRIWIIGDSGTANANAAAVRDAYKQYAGSTYTDLMLMLGDNAYNDGKDDQYQRAVFDMYPGILRQTPVWPTLGNHDGHAADSATQSGPYYDIFSLPAKGEVGGLGSGTEAYYSFDYANIHFVCLDSYETDRSKEGPMLTWLRNDLAATKQDWIISFWHHPPYTKGSHDSDREKNLIDMRQNVLPILEEFGADMTFSGHSHCYERSHLAVGHYGKSDTMTAAMIPQPDTNEYTKASSGSGSEPAVHTVAGASGKLGGGKLDHPIMKVSLRELGSVVLEVDGLKLKALYLNSDGKVRDTYSIEKR